MESILFCIPFAGGNEYSYRPLEQCMHNPSIRVLPLELAGRGRRSHEMPALCMQTMALDLMECMRPFLDRPFALFGHSMGALAAYLVAVQLAEKRYPLPSHLFLSGKGAPNRISGEAKWHTLSLDEFKRRLAAMGGCPADMLHDHELIEYFLPIIREDLRISEEYRYKPVSPLPVPITVMVGTADPATRVADVLEWSEMTTAGCRVLEYDGGHFFLFNHLDDICDRIRSTLMSSGC